MRVIIVSVVRIDVEGINERVFWVISNGNNLIQFEIGAVVTGDVGFI